MVPERVTLADVVYYATARDLLKRYVQTAYVPYSTVPPVLPDAFNMFVGFPIRQYVATKKVQFTNSRMYKHIVERLCANHEVSYKWVFSWLAHMVQKPYEVPGTACVFHSIQGTGKDMFGKFIRRIVGKNCSDVYDNTDQFFS